VQSAFANAVIVRPAVMFGEDDAFLNAIFGLLRRLPAYPTVRTRADAATAGLCGGCSCGGRAVPRSRCSEPNDVRIWRSACVHLQGAYNGDSGPAWETAHLGLRAVCSMASVGAASGGADQSQSGGAHGDRHRRLGGIARVFRLWHRAAAFIHRGREYIGRSSRNENQALARSAARGAEQVSSERISFLT
jgi:hypothetical protein